MIWDFNYKFSFIHWYIEKQSIYKTSYLFLFFYLKFTFSSVHWNTRLAYSPLKPLWTVIALVFLWIKLKSFWTGFTNMSLIIMYRLVVWANTILIFLIPNHIIWTAFAHFVLSIILWRSRRACSTFFIYFIKILIFISIAICIYIMLLMQGLYKSY